MPLTPEQREAWEREKEQRELRIHAEKESTQKRHEEQEKIDQAIRLVERKEKKKKLLTIGLVVVVYGLIALWYFVLR